MLDFTQVLVHWPLFLEGLQNTIVICVVSFLAGGLLAVPIALLRVYNVPVLSQIAGFYIYLFRGTPLLIQTYLIYFGLAEFPAIRESILWPIFREAWWCVLISFSINTSAYMAAILAGAIKGVPKGETEAATAIGMSPWLAFRRIIMPRAFGAALPMIGNEAIFKVHSSAIASTVTILDILGAGRYVNARYYLPYEGFIAAAVLYMAIVFCVVQLFAFLERRFLRHLGKRIASEPTKAAPQPRGV